MNTPDFPQSWIKEPSISTTRLFSLSLLPQKIGPTFMLPSLFVLSWTSSFLIKSLKNSSNIGFKMFAKNEKQLEHLTLMTTVIWWTLEWYDGRWSDMMDVGVIWWMLEWFDGRWSDMMTVEWYDGRWSDMMDVGVIWWTLEWYDGRWSV